MDKENYYKIPISMVSFWYWLAITAFFVIITMGLLFFLLIIPIIIYFQLKNTQYLYNNKEFIIKKGITFKINKNIAINKIEQVDVKLGLLTLIVQAKPISLNHIKNLDKEADKFINVWNENR